MTYIQNSGKEEGCVFCNRQREPDGPGNLIVKRGKRTFVILNRYPYTSGHLMVVPYDHMPSLELLDSETRAEIMEMAAKATRVLEAEYHPEGFNLGINIGVAAGAGITDHVHMHVVPRWVGDTNFMTTLSQTRVLPETLEETYKRVMSRWEEMNKEYVKRNE